MEKQLDEGDILVHRRFGNRSAILHSYNMSDGDPVFFVNESTAVSTHGSTFNDVMFHVYYFGGLFIVSMFTIIGNALIIQALVKNDYGLISGVRRNRLLRTPSNYFLFSLSVSDLLLGFVYPIYNVSHMNTDAIKESLGLWVPCDVILTLTLGLLYISSFNLVGITITRYISIRDPLKFPLQFTHRRALAAVVFTWVALSVLSCATYVRNEPSGYQNDCRYEKILNKYDIVITTCFFVLLPLLVMTTLYIHIAIIARKQSGTLDTRQVECSINLGLAQKAILLRREMRLLKMASLLVGYFAFAWLPFVAFEFYSITHEKDVNRWIRATVRIILHSNTAVNVAIYAGRLRDFREAIKSNIGDTFRSCIQQSQTQTAITTGRYRQRDPNEPNATCRYDADVICQTCM